MKKRYFMDNKDEVYKDFPNTNRLGWCSKCGQIDFVDEPGGPFRRVADSCALEDPKEQKRCKYYGVLAMKEKKKAAKEAEERRKKLEADPKYQKQKKEFYALYDSLKADAIAKKKKHKGE